MDARFSEDYGRTFAYSAQELREFRSATTKLAIGPEASVEKFSENFDAYLFK